MRRTSPSLRWTTQEIAAVGAVAVLAFMTVSACQIDTTTGPQGPYITIYQRDCSIDLGNLPNVKGRIDFDRPTKCPLGLAIPSQIVNLSAMITLSFHGSFNSGYYPYGAISDTWVDQGNKPFAASLQPRWDESRVRGPSGVDEDTLAYIYERGSYVAGDSLDNCAPNRQGQPCEDRQQITLQRSTPGPNGRYEATLTTHLPYQHGSGLSYDVAPGQVAPNDPIEVHAAINSPFIVSPVTYAWKRDGQPVPGDSVYQGNAGPGGPNGRGGTEIDLTVTDVNGNAVSGGTYVEIAPPCGGTIMCSRTAASASTTVGARRPAGWVSRWFKPAPTKQRP